MVEPSELVSNLYVHSPSKRATLGLGLLIDSFQLSQAGACVLRDIIRSDFARLQLVICKSRCMESRTPTLSRRHKKLHRIELLSALLWKLYNRLDRRLTQPQPDPFSSEDCESILENIDRETLTVNAKSGEQLPADKLAAIRARDLDVLLQFGFTENQGVMLQTAKYGIWSLHYGDYDCYRGGPPYFWELYERSVLSGLTLICSCEPGSWHILAKALFPTELGLSVRRNATRPFWAFSQIVMQKLWELHTQGWDFVKRRMIQSKPYSGKRIYYRLPTNTELIRWFAPQAAVKLAKRAKWTLTNTRLALQWCVAIRTVGKHICGTDGKVNTDGFRWLDSPKRHFYADPFVVNRDGQHWLFFEDYDYQTKRGRIACAPLSSSGDLGGARIVLEVASHLSYPYIFTDGDSLYMIPESGAERVVRLYSCVDFPYRWTPVADLFHGPAFDTSVCQHNGLWWFFTTLEDPRGHGIALYLFFSDSLKGKWQYHPANPISFDVRNARGAGRLFKSGGKLIRPSQSGAIRYGYSFALNEVLTLTPSEYEERTMLTVEPELFGNLMATHTYNCDGSIEVIDGQKLIPLSHKVRGCGDLISR
jgi:hypothetical protein